MSLDSQDSYIFANFIEPSHHFCIRKGLSSRTSTRRTIFQSRIQELIYSFDSKIAISHVRKQSCSKLNSRTALLPIYKLRENARPALRSKLRINERLVMKVDKV
jgi:hypothetical protein